MQKVILCLCQIFGCVLCPDKKHLILNTMDCSKEWCLSDLKFFEGDWPLRTILQLVPYSDELASVTEGKIFEKIPLQC